MEKEKTLEQKYPVELTESQLARMKHYEATLPFLRMEQEYEELITKIEENRFKRIVIMAKLAETKAPPPPGPDQKKEDQKS